MKTMILLLFILRSTITIPSTAAEPPTDAPYPPSPIIESVTFDFTTHKRFAPGSDNWPITWAGDGHQYTAWGDGGGFSGTNSQGRVTLGVARVQGDKEDYQGFNVWGGQHAEAPSSFGGKSYGILCVENILYLWVAPQPNPHLKESRLAWSIDYGKTWQQADWAFSFDDQLTIPTFLNFGKNYESARDIYVYSYYIHPTWGPGNSTEGRHGFDVHAPGRVYLSRVPKEAILDRDQYQFFAGMDEDENPRWSSDLIQKQPAFEDSNGVGWNMSVSYNKGIKRYILCTEHTETHAGKLGIFDAPEPWGPWATIAYDDNWGEGHIPLNTFYWNFSNKWLSEDGKRFVLLFTGKDENDSWNTVEGEFLLK